MTPVRLWTGREARALRKALRLSVRAFAEQLGVAARTVSDWEKRGTAIQPRPDTQAILDTALARADAAQQMRFQMLVAEFGGVTRHQDASPASPLVWEYESWTDDLERAVVALSRQDFTATTRLLDRWLTRYPPDQLDAKGLYLHARSLVLRGDVQRDQGALAGPLSAQRSYRQAQAMFSELHIPRRVAQIELSLAVVTEMTGELDQAALCYQRLADDERLSRRDRARSRLWIGTALSKAGHHDYAIDVMSEAINEFEDLGETEDWATGQQKLALAYRGTGALDQALRYIDVARTSGTADTPMQRVRLATAHAHILLSDKATRQDGFQFLDEAGKVATASRLTHQVRSIQTIRRSFEGAFERAG